MKDARGSPSGSASSAAHAAAEQALWRAMSFFGTPLDDLDAASTADPAWALPPIMKACFLLSLTEPSLLADARAALDAAQPLAEQPHAPERERAHLAAARACAAGDWAGACAQWGAVAEAHPRDGFALQFAHLFDFHRGDAAALLRRPSRALPAWPHDDPLRPYVQAMHAFGLEENARYAEAEALGREAADSGAKVPWATHAVAHVMEMQGRVDAGVRWLEDQRPVWAERNGFANHHWWHLGLFRVEALDGAAALALYDERLSSANCAATLQRLDGAALLWRLHLLGVDVGMRWNDIADGWDLSPAAAGHSPFNDLHALLALIGQGRDADAAAFVGAVERVDGPLAREVSVPLLHGMRAAGRGHWAEALRQLAPLRATLPRIGGSHAQRDLVEQTLLAAAAGSGELSLGRGWLEQRLRGRAETPLAAHWRARLGGRLGVSA